MRLALLVLGLVGIAVLATLWLRGNGERAGARRAVPEVERAAESAARAELPEASAPVAETRARVVARESEAVGERPDPAEARAEPDAGSLQLSGSIVVVDEQGVEHPAEDGSFRLLAWSSDMAVHLPVDVRAGAWTLELARELEIGPLDALGAADFVLGGRGAVDDRDPGTHVPIPEDGALDLRVRWPSPTLLYVRDRATGRELAPVLLAEVRAWPQSHFAHPGTAGEDPENLGPSPVSVPLSPDGLSDKRIVHARSPGYGWARIEIDESLGGERFLLLDPAGELEVVLAGAEPVAGTRLRLFDTGYEPVFEQAVTASGSIVIEALPARSYRVVAEIGDYWSETLVLDETKTEVVAGRRTGVTLTLERMSPPNTAPFSGTLLLPTEWQLTAFVLVFEPLGTPLGGGDGRFSRSSASMESTDEPGLHRWSAPNVQPGRYSAALEELGFYTILEVPPGGRTDARIEIPSPCRVSVRCVDDETNAPVEVEALNWTCKVPEGLNGWGLEQAEWNEASGRWEFRAPRGEVTISTWSRQLEMSMEDVLAIQDTNEFVLRTKAATGLELVLLDGETRIPWDDAWTVAVAPMEAHDGNGYWCHGGSVRARAPGSYLLAFDEIPGYERLPQQRVQLEKGVVKEYVLRLVRKR